MAPQCETVLRPNRRTMLALVKLPTAIGTAIAANLERLGSELSAAWDAPDGVAAAWKTPGPNNPLYRDEAEAAKELLGVLVHAAETIRDQRIEQFYKGDPKKALPRQAIYWRSGNTFRSITAYRWWDWDPANDGDGTSLPVVTKNQQANRQRQFSQELRLASPADQPLTYLAGLFFYDRRSRDYEDLHIGKNPLPPVLLTAPSVKPALSTSVSVTFCAAPEKAATIAVSAPVAAPSTNWLFAVATDPLPMTIELLNMPVEAALPMAIEKSPLAVALLPSASERRTRSCERSDRSA